MSHRLDDFFSVLGKEVVYPKQGILSQAAEAKQATLNASIGVALDDDGKLLGLESVSSQVNLPKSEYLGYPPMMGIPKLRKNWQQQLFQKNPSLKGEISLPVCTVAISHAIHIMGMLFLDKGDDIFLPHLYWENYDLILRTVFGTQFKTFPTFVNNEKFNTEGLKSVLQKSTQKRKIISLNAPNNPTGYTPSNEEFQEISRILLAEAEQGTKVVVLLDDAYFGLVFDESASKESLFSFIAHLHPNILAVKMDGATKEHYAWGLRVGFVTFGNKGATPEDYQYLEEKTATMIRASVSMGPHISQSIMYNAYSSSSFDTESKAHVALLRERFVAMKNELTKHTEYNDYFESYPCNSGYFASFFLKKSLNAESLRVHLLAKYKVGIIALENNIRIAFSSVKKDDIALLLDSVYRACLDLDKS